MNQKRALVVMNNGDVYYAGREDAERVRDTMMTRTTYVSFIDLKSGARVALNPAQISSLVEETPRA